MTFTDEQMDEYAAWAADAGSFDAPTERDREREAVAYFDADPEFADMPVEYMTEAIEWANHEEAISQAEAEGRYFVEYNHMWR